MAAEEARGLNNSAFLVSGALQRAARTRRENGANFVGIRFNCLGQ